MSTISNRHNVVPFVSGESKPFTGQRLARVGYKGTEENKAKGYKSICASVPPVDVSSMEFESYLAQGAFNGIIRTALENAQDGILKSLYESSGGQLSSIGDEEICLGACLAFIESESNGGRLTKEMVEDWFTREVSENLSVILAERLKYDISQDLTPEQIGTIEKHLNGYKGLFGSLSGGKTVLNVQQISSLVRCLDLCAPADQMAGKLRNRLDTLSKKPDVEELLGL